MIGTSKNLNMNHVFEIMIRLNSGMDMKESLVKSIPSRRIGKVYEEEQPVNRVKKPYKNIILNKI